MLKWTLEYLFYSQGYDTHAGTSSTFRDSLELRQKPMSGGSHEYATLGVISPPASNILNSSQGMSTIPSMPVAPMARGESVSSSSSTNASSNYSQYHTCDKPKKRVTIVEGNNSESCV